MNNKIRFVLDDRIQEIDFVSSGYKPTTTVLKYLRSLRGHKGTKEGCGEGDCGACTVVLAEIENEKFRYYAANSCLIFLPMLHGKQLITVENLADAKGNLHPVQQAMIDCYGSQCGFCTPGFVMSLFALYKSPLKINRENILDAITGNLCRCTGYLPIIKAAEKACKKREKDIFSIKEKHTLSLLKSINCEKTITIKTNSQTYFKVFSLEEALTLKSLYPSAILISGNTDTGLRVTKKHETIKEIIDISSVKELKNIIETKENLSIGANVTIEVLKNISEKKFPELYNILNVFGSKQIRNLATIGGNIGSASPIGDTLPLLIAYDAVVAVSNKNNSRIIKMQDLIKDYRTTVLKPDEIICSIGIPFHEKDKIFRAYKISKRKDLDISTCSGGFMLRLDKKHNKVKDIVLAFGGMAAVPKRATLTENFLREKPWNKKTVLKASKILYEEFQPISDARSGKEFRRIATRNLLIKFFEETSLTKKDEKQ